MAQIIKPPAPLQIPPGTRSVFLAGSIDQGAAENWQATVELALADLPLIILNPRRDDWDATWDASATNPQFCAQVEWELEAQELATTLVMYFAPASLAPITLLELGLFARSGRLVVCCPAGFWRKGNVDLVCIRYNVPMVDTLDQLIVTVRKRASLEL